MNGPPPVQPAAAGGALPGADALLFEPALQRADRAELEVGGKDQPHGRRLVRVHQQRPPALGRQVVAEGQGAAHPHAARLGGGDLVADALAGDLALELREGEQHVQRQPAHAAGGVERLGDADEADLVPVEALDDADEVGERPGQPVDLVDHDHIDLAGGDVGQQPLQRRPLHRPAGEAAIVVAGLERPPAFAGLALDVGGAGGALGIEAVEVLLQPLLGALAGVERAAPDRPGHRPGRLSPKNRGPFQRVPAIAVAAAERLG